MDENDTDHTKIPEVVLPIPNLRRVKVLSYDPVDEDIYWIEGKTNIIKRATANGTYVS
jgi:low density lipoprotein receptor-related protein 5/6